MTALESSIQDPFRRGVCGAGFVPGGMDDIIGALQTRRACRYFPVHGQTVQLTRRMPFLVLLVSFRPARFGIN
jgi:hypothetical protein